MSDMHTKIVATTIRDIPIAWFNRIGVPNHKRSRSAVIKGAIDQITVAIPMLRSAFCESQNVIAIES